MEQFAHEQAHAYCTEGHKLGPKILANTPSILPLVNGSLVSSMRCRGGGKVRWKETGNRTSQSHGT